MKSDRADQPDASAPDASELCTACGLCCAGLFGRIRLRAGDLALAERAGTPIEEREGALYARLPCAFLAGTVCTVYADRYAGCRSFACTLLRRHLDGDVDRATAIARITEMHRLLAALRSGGRSGGRSAGQSAAQTAAQTADPADRPAAARARLRRVAFDLYADRHFRKGPAAPAGEGRDR